MRNKKKILLLGGEGFIGANLIECLASSFSCYSIGPRKSVFKLKNRIFIKQDPYFSPVKDHFDIVIHLVDQKVEEQKLLKLERKLIKNLSSAFFDQFIFFSSTAIYSSPNSEYAKRKILLEEFYSSAFDKKVNVAILRLFNTFGPYQLPNRPGSLIANILINYLLNKETEIMDRTAKRDFIYVKDVAKQVRKVIDEKFSGVDDLSANKLISISKLIKVIENEVVGEKLPTVDMNQKEKIKIRAGKSKLAGKIALTPMNRALKETYSFYLKNLAEIKRTI